MVRAKRSSSSGAAARRPATRPTYPWEWPAAAVTCDPAAVCAAPSRPEAAPTRSRPGFHGSGRGRNIKPPRKMKVPRGSGVPLRWGRARNPTVRGDRGIHRGGTPLPRGRCATFMLRLDLVRDARARAGMMIKAERGLGHKPGHRAICTVVGPRSGPYRSRCCRRVRRADRPRLRSQIYSMRSVGQAGHPRGD